MVVRGRGTTVRRTGATLMRVCGIDESIVDRRLNHSHATVARNKRVDPRLLKTYQRYDYEKEMRSAWRSLGEYLANLDGTLTQITGCGEIAVANDAQTVPSQIEAA